MLFQMPTVPAVQRLKEHSHGMKNTSFEPAAALNNVIIILRTLLANAITEYNDSLTSHTSWDIIFYRNSKTTVQIRAVKQLTWLTCWLKSCHYEICAFWAYGCVACAKVVAIASFAAWVVANGSAMASRAMSVVQRIGIVNVSSCANASGFVNAGDVYRGVCHVHPFHGASSETPPAGRQLPCKKAM